MMWIARGATTCPTWREQERHRASEARKNMEGFRMIAMPHLLFSTFLFVAALIFWATDRTWPWADSAAAIPAVVVAGLAGGIVIGAWLVTPAWPWALALTIALGMVTVQHVQLRESRDEVRRLRALLSDVTKWRRSE